MNILVREIPVTLSPTVSSLSASHWHFIAVAFFRRSCNKTLTAEFKRNLNITILPTSFNILFGALLFGEFDDNQSRLSMKTA